MSRPPLQSSMERYVQKGGRPNVGRPPPRASHLMPMPSSSHSNRPESSNGGGQQFLRSLTNESTLPRLAPGPLKRSASSTINLDSRTKVAVTASIGDRPDATYKSQAKQFCIVTGSVEHVLHWRKIFPQLFALWEVYAVVLRVQSGTGIGEKLLLLRNGETGPVMQAFFFEIDFELPSNVVAGSTVRCVGRFVGNGCRFQLFKVRRLPSDALDYGELVSRLSALCNFVLAQDHKPSKMVAVL